ncbi:hypothetical protein NKH33_21100 [Mesorhizobium sp. M1182]|uniref:hypothetical protein n=1 Tax=Mesorhizobium sp. M1182 TaxID=2957067 RepID=UPI00333D84A4
MHIYFSRYSATVQVYVNESVKFVRRKLSVGVPAGHKAIAFLSAPSRSWLDMAVVDAKARLYRFQCAVK